MNKNYYYSSKTDFKTGSLNSIWPKIIFQKIKEMTYNVRKEKKKNVCYIYILDKNVAAMLLQHPSVFNTCLDVSHFLSEPISARECILSDSVYSLL